MKPAEPVTDAGKALLALEEPDESGCYDYDIDQRILAIEAQAQDLILSDVEGLARALGAHGSETLIPPTMAGYILAAWRQERQR